MLKNEGAKSLSTLMSNKCKDNLSFVTLELLLDHSNLDFLKYHPFVGSKYDYEHVNPRQTQLTFHRIS